MAAATIDPHMNAVERAIVHTRWRWLIQRFYEIPILQSIGLKVFGRSILEVGCGTGIAARQLVSRYGAASVLGVDVDAGIIAQASGNDRVSFAVADACRLPFADQSQTTVIGFGLLHHVPDWEAAVAEIGRVCRAGAMYAIDDFTASGLAKWYHRIFDHPRVNRFTTAELVECLHDNQFRIHGVTHRLAGDVVFLVAEKR